MSAFASAAERIGGASDRPGVSATPMLDILRGGQRREASLRQYGRTRETSALITPVGPPGCSASLMKAAQDPTATSRPIRRGSWFE
jgi:hypothetical protein